MNTVPILPPIDPTLLETCRVARVSARRRLEAAPPGAAAVFRWWARQRLVESLANLFFDDRPLLIPPRRRHLHRRFTARIAGCEVAYRHLDARSEMFRLDHVPVLIGSETPFVTNALAESHNPDRIETNPGLPRLTDTKVGQATYRPPPFGECAELVLAAVEVANVDQAPLMVRAGWLCSTMMAIHPFVDGNGRAARLLFQTLASADAELGVDWGAIEQWTMRREEYVTALARSWSIPLSDYDGSLFDNTPFIEFGLRTSTQGADVTMQRVAWFEKAWAMLGGTDDTVEAVHDEATIELAVASAWSASIAELDELVADPIATSTVNRLVADGRLEWDRRRLLRLAPGHPLLAMR